jgi:hypothetical protein
MLVTFYSSFDIIVETTNTLNPKRETDFARIIHPCPRILFRMILNSENLVTFYTALRITNYWILTK